MQLSQTTIKLAEFAAGPDGAWSLSASYIPPLVRLGTTPFFDAHKERAAGMARAVRQTLLDETSALQGALAVLVLFSPERQTQPAGIAAGFALLLLPYSVNVKQIHQWFPELESALPDAVAMRLAEAEAGGRTDPSERGAVWTYLTTDQPFGTWTERVLRGLRRKSGEL